VQTLAAARRRLLAAADSAAALLADQIVDKELSPADRRAAAVALMDRAGLKPTDKLELSGPDGGDIVGKVIVKLVRAGEREERTLEENRDDTDSLSERNLPRLVSDSAD
jgi:hypothetical protein